MGGDLSRFVESEQPVEYLNRFDHVLVHCPRCDRMAVRRSVKVTCVNCGYSRIQSADLLRELAKPRARL